MAHYQQAALEKCFGNHPIAIKTVKGPHNGQEALFLLLLNYLVSALPWSRLFTGIW